MRYKQVTLSNIEKISNIIRAIESDILRGDRENSLKWINKLKEVVENTRSQISVEHDEINVRLA